MASSLCWSLEAEYFMHHAISFDVVLYNRYVHMRALERTGGNEHWWALRELLVNDGELLVVLVVPT